MYKGKASPSQKITLSKNSKCACTSPLVSWFKLLQNIVLATYAHFAKKKKKKKGNHKDI
jgi:hypothetical protein